ncbi:MAG: hypothetical protein AB9873_07910 [Syntrophobacteraceae bacterium]
MFLTIDQLITWAVCSLIIYVALIFRLTMEFRYRRNRALRRRNKARAVLADGRSGRAVGGVAERCRNVQFPLAADDPCVGSWPLGQGRGPNSDGGEKVQQRSAGGA